MVAIVCCSISMQLMFGLKVVDSDGEKYFLSLGHLVGKGSIIELLNSKGFKSKHLLATDKLPR